MPHKKRTFRPVSCAGKHLLVEYTGCDPEILNDLELVRKLMIDAAAAAGTIVVGALFRPFCPQGVTGVVVIEESHLSIHTWPEHGYAAVDFFTCGHGIAGNAHAVLFQGLLANRAECLIVERGLSTNMLISVKSHTIETKNDRGRTSNIEMGDVLNAERGTSRNTFSRSE